MLILYHSKTMGLFFPYIPKQVQITRTWRHNVVIIADFANFDDFQWNMGQNWIFL